MEVFFGGGGWGAGDAWRGVACLIKDAMSDFWGGGLRTLDCGGT